MQLNEFERELAKRNLIDFAVALMSTFKRSWFHDSYYEQLDKFARGEIKKLMVFMPPQHGKSQGSTRFLPAQLLGRNPNLRIAVVSYNAPKARKFNREIQRVIDSEEYRQVFPNTCLNGKNVATSAQGSWLRNADEFEIVGHGGGVKSVGVGGPLTGEPVDILILDDIYKDAKSAWSPTIRESIEDWFDTVGDTRLHNDSQVLIVFTRWHQDDLAGRLLAAEPDEWTVITYPALKVGKPTKNDPRKEGVALWPEKHNEAKLLKSKKRNSHVFESLYQQNPKPLEGLLYKTFNPYVDIPNHPRKVRKAVIDTADTGDDALCCIIYDATPEGNYLVDVYYTDAGMEITESETAHRLMKYGVKHCDVESNNGGRSFARAVQRICRENKNFQITFKWFHQQDNKEVRIFTQAAEVQNMIFYPRGWDIMWPDFYLAVTGYLARGKNKHDDAPDALTMIVEMAKKKPQKVY